MATLALTTRARSCRARPKYGLARALIVEPSAFDHQSSNGASGIRQLAMLRLFAPILAPGREA